MEEEDGEGEGGGGGGGGKESVVNSSLKHVNTCICSSLPRLPPAAKAGMKYEQGMK